MESQNIFEFSRQSCEPYSGNHVLAPGVEKVVEGHPRALAVRRLHGVHAHRVGGHDVNGILGKVSINF